MASLNYAILNRAKNDGTYQVYIRYFFVDTDKKKKTEYFKTEVFLYKQQFDQLKAGKLKGNIFDELETKKEQYSEAITSFKSLNKKFPSKQELETKKEEITDPVKMFNLWSGAFVEIYVKPPSRRSYKIALDYMNKHTHVFDINIIFSDSFIFYLRGQMETENKREATISSYLTIIKQFLNNRAKKLGYNQITTKVKTNLQYDKYRLTKEDIDKLCYTELNIDKGRYKRKFINYFVLQDMIKINLVLGLRISEMISVRKNNLTFKDDYCIIKIFEKKKNRSRNLVTKDKLVIQLLKEYSEKTEDYLFPFRATTSLTNIMLRYMKYIEFNDVVTVVENIGGVPQENKYKKYEVVSFHSFRRYAITNNAKKHGLQYATAMSGHSNLHTVQNHYLEELTSMDMLELINK